MNKNFILIKANFENIKSLPVSNFGTIQSSPQEDPQLLKV